VSATDSPSPGLCVRNVSAGLNALVSRIPPAVTSSCREPAATTYPCRRRSRAGTGPAVEFRSSPLSQLTASSATPASRATGPRPCCAAVAGVADVHAAGLIRRDVQAHLAVARVAEQSPSSTPTSLLVRTRTSRLAGGARPPHRPENSEVWRRGCESCELDRQEPLPTDTATAARPPRRGSTLAAPT
jgi:hypothetical protein